MVVLDTCAIIELCKNKIAISTNTRKLIEEGAYVLSISFAEIACKVKSGKLRMDTTPESLHTAFLQVPTVDIIKIGVHEWLQAVDLDWTENNDPADRVVTAFATNKNIPIVSSDKKMKKFYNKVIW